MNPKDRAEAEQENVFCPECGTEESGYFCRNCGTLLRGGEMVLCPRCHQVVPDAEYCNRCGQSLGGLALQLQQLAKAGEAFWVTSEPTAAAATAEPALFRPDESVPVVPAELPDWLEELNAALPAPQIQPRIHPALRPIEEGHQAGRPRTFFAIAVLLMFLLLLGLVVAAVLALLLRGG